MNVFLTGATGFLGSHIADSLIKRGHTVRCLVRGTSAARKESNLEYLKTLKNVELIEGSMEKADALDAALSGVDAVIHCAGIIKARSADEFESVNGEGTRKLAEAVVKAAPKLKRFVLVSSSAVMGASKEGVPHKPGDATNPVTHYGRSKLSGETHLLAFKDKLPITIVRPPAIYGPRDPESLAIFKILRWGVGVKLGNGLKLNSWVYGPDAADACARAAETDVPSGSIYFVEDGTPVGYDGLFDAFSHGLGHKTWGRFTVPNWILSRAAVISERQAASRNEAAIFNVDKLNEIGMEYHVLDSSQTRRDLGWSPTVDLHEGAKRAAEWYKERRWL